ncbi:DUF6907 domain-containing protein [Pseudonocardia sp.]|uniref:DUF6907 domain-containing protein n=1 Tax=Pseudonocardia sp. TaxID=60912 RepID=UPI003D0F6A0D
MTIQPNIPAPDVLHPAWCDPGSHHYDETDDLDRWHRSAARGFETLDSREHDPSRVDITIERLDSRPDGCGPWVEARPTVLLRTVREVGTDFDPHEARLLARLLLEAADVADGVQVTW